jgi:hypothetical protein
VIVRGYMRALQTALDTCNQISRTIDVNNTTEMREIVTSVRCFFTATFFLAVWTLDRTCVGKIRRSLMVSLTRY